MQLTAEQREFFQREGYLRLEALTDAEDVARLREIYDDLFARQAGRDQGDGFDLAGTDEDGKAAALPQILHPDKYAPALLESRLLANATELVKQLLGPDAEARFFHAIYKPAHHGAPTPWHQDAAYGSPDVILQNVSIWVPLQEANEQNGGLQFVPRSQELDVVTHRPINDDPRVHGLEVHPDELWRVQENVVSCPLPAGGCTVHGPYMLHYAPPNHSDIPRRALILTTNLPKIPRDTPRRFPWLEHRQTARQARAETGGA